MSVALFALSFYNLGFRNNMESLSTKNSYPQINESFYEMQKYIFFLTDIII